MYARLEATYAAADRARDFEGYLNGLIEERPDDVQARLALARALAARGATDEALEQLRVVLERDPDDLDARRTLGRILLSESRDAEAAKAYAELLDVLDRRRFAPRAESLE